MFSEAKIEPAGTEPSVRDAIVNLTENEKTTNFIAGVGASSDNGLVGNIELSNTNFDTHRPAEDVGGVLPRRAFRGPGRR